MIVVHVIGPFDSFRHEEHFPDDTTDAEILATLYNDDITPGKHGAMGVRKRTSIGFVKQKVQDTETQQIELVDLLDEGGNPQFVVGHPQTVIAVGTVYTVKGEKFFREVRRLKP